MYSLSFLIRSRLLGIAAPATVGLVAAAAAVDTTHAFPSAFVADSASSLHQLTSLIDLETAFNGMLLGRGDPKTRKGKCRPKQKMDWRQWSESQLLLPERDIPIPWPPAAKRSQVVPFPELALGEDDLELVKEWAADLPLPELDSAGHDDLNKQQQQQQ